MAPAPLLIGRYALHGEIASGGMATVHYGRLLGAVGFARTVAIKRLHPQYAKDPDFVSMFMDEARVASRIRHPNVVQTLDVVALDGELFLIMEYVAGQSLSQLLRELRRDKQAPPPDVVSAILCGTLHGLHAAHEAKNDHGEPLNVVHRDVSPHNVLVSVEGLARVLDFGVAKAAGAVHTTREGQIKGKLAYMPPEQLRAGKVDRRTDVYAAGVVLWEALTTHRLFAGDSEGMVLTSVLEQEVVPPSTLVPGISKGLDEIVLRAVAREPHRRFETAKEMALALEACLPPATASRVGHWLEGVAGDVLLDRSREVARIEEGVSPLAIGGAVEPLPAKSDRAIAPSEATEVGETASLSIARGVEQDRRARVRRRNLLFGLAVALVGLGLAPFVVAGRQRHELPSAVGTPPSDFGSASTGSSSTPVPPPAPAVSENVATGSIKRSAAPAPVRAPPSRPPSPPRAPAGSASSSAPCPLRSYVDESGIKQYVRDCK